MSEAREYNLDSAYRLSVLSPTRAVPADLAQWRRLVTRLLLAGLLVAQMTVVSGAAGLGEQRGESQPMLTSDSLPPDAFSAALLGAYRKLLEIDGVLSELAARHGVDLSLVRTLCLASERLDLAAARAPRHSCLDVRGHGHAGSKEGTLEEGVRHLADLTRRFPRPDYAIAAYYAGSASVGRVQVTDLETLHLISEAGHYRAALSMYEPSIRRHAKRLRLAAPLPGEAWEEFARRLAVPLSDLRLYNPFATPYRPQPGAVAAYSLLLPHPEPARADGGVVHYQVRIGDTCTAIAALLAMPVAVVRATGAWCAAGLPPGLVLQLPLRPETEYDEWSVRAGDTIESLATLHDSDPWLLRRAAGLLPNGQPGVGSLVWIPRWSPAANWPQVPVEVHTVTRGDTLSTIARRYGVTVGALQAANGMGTRTVIRVGEQLALPLRP